MYSYRARMLMHESDCRQFISDSIDTVSCPSGKNARCISSSVGANWKRSGSSAAKAPNTKHFCAVCPSNLEPAPAVRNLAWAAQDQGSPQLSPFYPGTIDGLEGIRSSHRVRLKNRGRGARR